MNTKPENAVTLGCSVAFVMFVIAGFIFDWRGSAVLSVLIAVVLLLNWYVQGLLKKRAKKELWLQKAELTETKSNRGSQKIHPINPATTSNGGLRQSEAIEADAGTHVKKV